MQVPEQQVVLTSEQVASLSRKLAELRHGINNQLSLIVAATELIRRKPEMGQRTLDTLAAQPQRIADAVQEFSTEFEKVMGLRRP
jgi:hypothetical protein